MNYMTFIVDHDVLIMPVFNLQDVANERVGSQRVEECILSMPEIFSLFAFPKTLQVKIE